MNDSSRAESSLTLPETAAPVACPALPVVRLLVPKQRNRTRLRPERTSPGYCSASGTASSCGGLGHGQSASAHRVAGCPSLRLVWYGGAGTGAPPVASCCSAAPAASCAQSPQAPSLLLPLAPMGYAETAHKENPVPHVFNRPPGRASGCNGPPTARFGSSASILSSSKLVINHICLARPRALVPVNSFSLIWAGCELNHDATAGVWQVI